MAERLGSCASGPSSRPRRGSGRWEGASAASLAAGLPLPEVGLVYPLLTLRESALANNLAAMAAYYGGYHRPAADIAGVRLSRLLLANELTDPAGITWLAAELAADPGFEAHCYVDSSEGMAILDQVLREHPAGRPLPVLVEIGHADGRTGCRTREQALAVAKAAQATSTLVLAGVAGYEGPSPTGRPRSPRSADRSGP